jgi:hypothetical protein
MEEENCGMEEKVETLQTQRIRLIDMSNAQKLACAIFL